LESGNLHLNNERVKTLIQQALQEIDNFKSQSRLQSNSLVLKALSDGSLDAKKLFASFNGEQATLFIEKITNGVLSKKLSSDFTLLPQLLLQSIGYHYTDELEGEHWTDWWKKEKRKIHAQVGEPTPKNERDLKQACQEAMRTRLLDPQHFTLKVNGLQQKFQTDHATVDEIYFLNPEPFYVDQDVHVEWNYDPYNWNYYISQVRVLVEGRLYAVQLSRVH
jgi:hypothetical protein